ncbi:uncharacterized protein LOC131246509 [Magnolia sinica]|uniref:uncharacterized protein LOC131246509 n=1 Tax=Magnolia sinica TaxID=86752 RepID=UPI0026587DE6|nr:uncharacterized protein LOC131246509 [Magnolia sinica]
MEKRILPMLLLPLLLAAVFVACKAQKIEGCYSSSSCGNISNISFPFRLKDDPLNCGYLEYQLSCESNRTVLYLHTKKFWVESIEYKNQSILLVDSSLQSDCSSIPRDSATIRDIDPFPTYTYDSTWPGPPENTVFVNCSSQMGNDDPDSYIATTSCFNTTSGAYIYVLGRSMKVSELHPSCKIIGNAFGMPKEERIGESNYREIYDRLMKGFQLIWGDSLAYRHYCTNGRHVSCSRTKELGGVSYVACICYSDCDKFYESWVCKFLILNPPVPS